jgi:hypothetical protein
LRLLYDAGDCPNANCVSFSNVYVYAYVYAYTDVYAYSDIYADTYSYGNVYANTDADSACREHLPARHRDHE